MGTIRIDSASMTPASPAWSQDRDRGWAVAVHLLALILTPLVPILVNMVFGPRSEFVSQHARQAINFQLNALVALIASGMASAISQGFLILWAPLGLAYLVMPVVASVRAARGHWLPYPRFIPFLRSLPERV